MFIPLHDTNSLKYIKVQYVTIGLIVINTVVWLVTSSSEKPSPACDWLNALLSCTPSSVV